jgi:hypothetical protein
MEQRHTRAAAEIEATGEVTPFRELSAHGGSVAVALTAIATEFFSITTDAILGAATKR